MVSGWSLIKYYEVDILINELITFFYICTVIEFLFKRNNCLLTNTY